MANLKNFNKTNDAFAIQKKKHGLQWNQGIELSDDDQAGPSGHAFWEVCSFFLLRVYSCLPVPLAMSFPLIFANYIYF